MGIEELTRRPEYTAEEFERYWLAGSKITAEQLQGLGRVVRPCDCDYSECRGWQMTFLDLENIEYEVSYRNEPD